MSKTQINISIPDAWKEQLDQMTTADISCADLIRKAIAEKYGFEVQLYGESCTSLAKFAKTYFSVTWSKKGPCEWGSSFILEPFQERFIKHIEDNKFTIATKFRNGGFTTLTILWAIWKCVTTPNLSIQFIANREVDAIALSRIADTYILQLPDSPQTDMGRCSRDAKEFLATKSCIHFHHAEASRGRSCTHMFIDEAAFIRRMDQKWKFLYPTVMQAEKLVVLSTQKNDDWTWFDEMYQDALAGKNSFKIFSSLYTESSHYADPKKNEEMKKAMGEAAWLQEVEQCKLFHPAPIGHAPGSQASKTQQTEQRQDEK